MMQWWKKNLLIWENLTYEIDIYLRIWWIFLDFQRIIYDNIMNDLSYIHILAKGRGSDYTAINYWMTLVEAVITHTGSYKRKICMHWHTVLCIVCVWWWPKKKKPITFIQRYEMEKDSVICVQIFIPISSVCFSFWWLIQIQNFTLQWEWVLLSSNHWIEPVPHQKKY